MRRTWIVWCFLLLTPLAVFWPTVFHEYGFRDDYAHLREARDVPWNLVRFTGSYGRPIYGSLLVASVGSLEGRVAGLQWLRLTAVLLFTVLGVSLWRMLQRAGWSNAEAAAIGLAITLLPGAQVVVGWSIAWPIVFSLLLALAGFATTEGALRRQGLARVPIWAGGCLCYIVSGLTYQPSALFAIVPLAAFLLVRNDSARDRIRWTLAHLVTLFGSLAVTFVLIELLFKLGVFPQSAVVSFEVEPLYKLWWFISGPVANALGMFALRDRFDTELGFWLAVLVTATVITLGVRLGPVRSRVDKWTWLFCLPLLPFAAHSVSSKREKGSHKGPSVNLRQTQPINPDYPLVVRARCHRATAWRT